MKYLNPKLYSFALLRLLINGAEIRAFRPLLNFISYCSEKVSSLKIVAVHWLDQCHTIEKIKLRDAAHGLAYGPDDATGSPESNGVILPAVYYYNLREVAVTADGSSFLKPDSIIVERLQSQTKTEVNYNAGQLSFRKGKYAIVRFKPSIVIEKGFFLGGNGSFNYYHWLIELLPKLEFLGRVPADFPILVSEEVNRFSSFADTLRILAPERKLIMLSKTEQYKINELVYITTASNLPFNVDAGEHFQVSDFLISPRSIHFLRRGLLVQSDRTQVWPKRIFLKRDQGRRSYNQEDIESRLLSHGFVAVACDKLSFSEQVQMFSNAEAIVGPTGAAWTNLVFCKPGCKALCWMAEEFNTFSSFSTLAALCQVGLTYFYYVSGVSSTSELYNTKYHVNMDVFDRYLNATLASLDENASSIIS